MRKLLLSMLATFLVIGLVGAGTFAWFQDTETSTENTFQAGTLNLKLWGPNGWTDDGLTGTWTMPEAMIPGVTESNLGSVDLRQFGTIAGTSLEISCDYTVTEVWQEPDTEDTSLVPVNFAKYLEITHLRYEDSDWYINGLTGEKIDYSTNNVLATSEDWKVSDTDGVGGVSLFDLKVDSLINLPPPDGTHKFSMKLKFHADAGNNLQGDIFNGTIKFILHQ